jgi:hypothetical protein
MNPRRAIDVGQRRDRHEHLIYAKTSQENPMAYLNFPALTKNQRASQINTDLSTAAYLCIYSGTQPVSPDITVSSGTLLAALPCSNPAGVVTRNSR